jgi:hypothetical protein
VGKRRVPRIPNDIDDLVKLGEYVPGRVTERRVRPHMGCALQIIVEIGNWMPENRTDSVKTALIRDVKNVDFGLLVKAQFPLLG